MAIIFPDEGRKGCLQNIFSDNGLVAQAFLYKTDVALTQATQFADLVEANFTGYTAWGFGDDPAVIIDGDGNGSLSATITFEREAGATSNTIYGWGIRFPNYADSGTILLFVERLPAPVEMNTVGDTITLPLTFTDLLAS